MDQDLSRRRLLGLGAAAAGTLLLPADPAFALAATGPRARSRVLRLGTGRTFGPVAVPGGLDLAGLRWRGGDAVRAELRVRRAGGRFGPWLPLAHAHDHAPDSAPHGHGTDPAWTGRADEVEVRLERSVAALTLHTVRVSGARAVARAAKRQTALSPGAPPIITRAQWGGDKLKTKGSPQEGEVRLAFVHHTVNQNDYSAQDSAAIVLAIAHYHIDSNGWNDIGYNFLVDRFGQIFEGREGGIENAIIGAQAQGWNSVSTGVANLGTFESVAQVPAALDALARLIAWKLSLHGVPVLGTVDAVSRGGASNRYPSGKTVTFQRISGHRDGCSTSCPGAALYAQLPELRRRTDAAPKVPEASETPAPEATLGSPSLTLTGATKQVPAGSDIALAGALLAADKRPVADAPVSVQVLGSKRWVTVARARTGGDGGFAVSVAVRRSGRLRAHFGGGGAHAVVSPELAVSALPVLTATAAARRVVEGRAVRVDAHVAPVRPRVVVAIARQLPDGSFAAAGTVRLRVRGASASGDVRLSRAGLYRLTVSAPADVHGAAASAPALFVRATHRAHPGGRTGGAGA